MNDERKDGGGLMVILSAGCLVILLCLVSVGAGWFAFRRWVAADQAAAERAELQAMQQAAAAKAMTEELVAAGDGATQTQSETEAAGTLPKDVGWTISITDGLNAYFKQSAGPSKPGTDWLV